MSRSSRHQRPKGSGGFFVVTLAIGGVFAYLALRDIRFDETWTALRRSSYWWLLPSFVLLVVSTLLRAVRWRLLYVPSRRPPLRAIWDASLVGLFFNNVLPARAGDAARVAALREYAGTPLVESAATVAVERLFDVLALLALLFAAAPFLPPVSWLRAAAALALGLSVGLATAVVAFYVFGERPIRFVLAPLKRVPGLTPERLDVAVENLVHGLVALRRPRLGFATFVLTALSWVVLGMGFWFLMLGFDLGLSPLAGVLVVVAVGLAMIVPSPPAAVGVFEAAGLAALSPYGVPDSRALAYVLVLHALNVLPFTAGGLGVLLRSRRVRGAAASLPDLRDDWDAHWQSYATAAGVNPAQEYRRRLVLSLLNAGNGARILDVGAGTGELATVLSRAFPGADVVGLELSEAGVEIAREAAPAATFLQRDLLADGDPGVYRQWATHAVCSEVLEHVDDPQRLLANVIPYLQPGCRLVLTVPGGPISDFDRHIGHRRHFTPQEVEELLDRSGFEVERALGAGFPFFNLYRRLVILRGDRLIEDVRGRRLSAAARTVMFAFGVLFRLNATASRRGWQIVASARLREGTQ